MQQQLTAEQQALVNEYTHAINALKDASNALTNADADNTVFLNEVVESLKKYVMSLASYAAYKKIPQLDSKALKLISSKIDYFTVNTEYYTIIYINNIVFSVGLSHTSYDEAFEDAAAKGIKYMNGLIAFKVH